MRAALVFLLLVVSSISGGLSAQELRYWGICDASAAVALDADHFIVADDDKNTLRVYRRDQAKEKLSVSLEGYLDARNSDLEGAAQIGNLIYWISSHGQNKKKRRRLFATRIVEERDGPAVMPLSSPPYRGLLQDLLDEPKLQFLDLSQAAGKDDDKQEGALNIEGLAATPEGHLLIGFRNPLKGTKAIVIPVRNPKAIVEHGAKPDFGDAILLDLDGRGIRSIEWAGDRYLIIAGPFDTSRNFMLYAWSGNPEDDPVALSNDFGSLNPEAVFVIPGRKAIQIISDDGNNCKDVPEGRESFRSITVPLP